MEVNNQQSRMDKYWVDSPNLYDRNLNFAAIASEDDEYGTSYSKTGNKKTSRDPQSHRIIEKRRRDRMNNCLADLSRLLPSAYMKKSRGRIEKTEIIEMTIKHMKHLQIHACKDIDACDIAARMENDVTKSEHYRSGFIECINEAVQFIGMNHQNVAAVAEVESGQQHHHQDNGTHNKAAAAAYYATEDFCNRLVAHLHNHCDKITRAAGDGACSDTGDQIGTRGGGTTVGRHHSPGGRMAIAAAAATTTTTATPGSINKIEDGGPTTHQPSTGSSGRDLSDQLLQTDGEKGKEERNTAMYNYLTQCASEHGPASRTGSHRLSVSGSAGSGGDSDETCASNRATRNSATPSPLQTDDSPGGNDIDHNSSYSGGSSHSSSSSQLRQMLTNGSGESSHSSSGTKSCSSSSSGSQAGAGHSGNNNDQDSMNAMYSLKFKTNIQQRFTAHNVDHEFPLMSNGSINMTPTSMNSGSYSDQQQQQQQQQQDRSSYEKVHNLKRKKSSQENIQPNFNWHHGHGREEAQPLPPPSPPLSRASSIRHSAQASGLTNATEFTSEAMETSPERLSNNQQTAIAVGGQSQGEFNNFLLAKRESVENVPIFALHPKGSFYVPMSVELPLISALFNSMETAPAPLLHPVTISVNFCHPLRVLSAPKPAAIEMHSPVHHPRPQTGVQQQQQSARPSNGPVLLIESSPPNLMPVGSVETRRHQPPHQRSHRHYELESAASIQQQQQQQQQQQHQMQQSFNGEDRRMIAIAARGRSYSRHYEEPPKPFRMPHRGEGDDGLVESCHSHYQSPPLVNNLAGKHSVPPPPPLRREYVGVGRPSREHGHAISNNSGNSNQTAIQSAIQSSRWSHLMAKRTHTQ